MPTKLIFALLLFVSTNICAQHVDSIVATHFGFIAGMNVSYNTHDKLLTPYLTRRMQLGLSYTNKKRQFIAYGSVGIKGSKINAYSANLTDAFIQNVQQYYTPIIGGGFDSLIAAKVNSNPRKDMQGSYAQYYQFGFILNTRFRPNISYCNGNEQFLLYDNAFRNYIDPKGDISYVSIPTKYHEIKIGCGIPFKSMKKTNFIINFNIGYKWVNYGEVSFNNTPLSKYTTGNLAEQYKHNNKLTYTITFLRWSNWYTKY